MLLDTCDNSSSLFSIFVQLRCSLSDSGYRRQENSRYTTTLDVVWTWYWLDPTCARSLLAAHRLYSFLLSSAGQLQMTLQTVVFCQLWCWSRLLRAARPIGYVAARFIADVCNCSRQVLVASLHFFLCGYGCYTWIRVMFRGFALSRTTTSQSLIGSYPTSAPACFLWIQTATPDMPWVVDLSILLCGHPVFWKARFFNGSRDSDHAPFRGGLSSIDQTWYSLPIYIIWQL